MPLTLENVAVGRRGRRQKSLQREEACQKLLNAIANHDFVVLCDEDGQGSQSLGFAQKMQSWFNYSINKQITFIIGGAYGVNPELKARANWVWSLSPLTMNHLVAELVLLEQIYRSLTILKNLPYHNDGDD